MGQDGDFRDRPPEAGESDDVEILEVVGLDDDDPAPAGDGRGPASPGARDEEVLLALEAPAAPAAFPTDAAAPTAEAPPASERELLLRLRADYDNLRKRIERERRDYELHASSALVGRLLPILDNLERALAVEAQPQAHEALREGVVLIHRQLNEELRREGLRAIDAVGRPFDPNLHDAVAAEPSPHHAPNTVIEELQRGYLFQDRVLRHAMVKVSSDVPVPEGGAEEAM
jgi:molecular chaperone GrpE